MKIEATFYLGQCSACKKYYQAFLVIKDICIPPPVIKVGCSCNTPPTEVELMYKYPKQVEINAP